MTTKSPAKQKPTTPKVVIRHAYQQQPIQYESIDASQDGLTEQHHFDSCCIEKIISQFSQTGQLPSVNPITPEYRDVTSADYQASMQLIAEANSYFESLPAVTRERFGNDPAQFLGFVSDDSNTDELIKMGLLPPKKEPEDTLKSDELDLPDTPAQDKKDEPHHPKPTQSKP